MQTEDERKSFLKATKLTRRYAGMNMFQYHIMLNVVDSMNHDYSGNNLKTLRTITPFWFWRMKGVPV